MDIHTLTSIKHTFREELVHAEEGKPSSLSFIRHPLPSPIIKTGETFQVLVIGGSIFHNALVKKEQSGISILTNTERHQPPFPTKEYFLQFVAQHIDPYVQAVAINLAYPVSPVLTDKTLDGVLIAGTKENAFEGMIGVQIGKAIQDYIKETRGQELTVAVANDAICLLLSGLRQYSINHLGAAIMGTGTNITCFHESNSVGNEFDAINLESANFDKFELSPPAAFVDRTSFTPGRALFEKETAGEYLYQLFNRIIQEQHITYPPLNSTKELKEIILQNPSDLALPFSLQEREQLHHLAFSLIERSAALFAAQLAGLAAYKKHSLTIIMEGSFFWEHDIYKKLVEEYIEKVSPEYSISLIKITNSPVVGGTGLVA